VVCVGANAGAACPAWSALLWAACALASAPFLVGDAVGKSAWDMITDPSLMGDLVSVLEQVKAWLITAGVAQLISVAAFFVLSGRHCGHDVDPQPLAGHPHHRRAPLRSPRPARRRGIRTHPV
jgi:hypothetical protein